MEVIKEDGKEEDRGTVTLNNEHVNRYVIGKAFDVPPGATHAYINAMGYSRCGERLVCSWNDSKNSLVAYDSINGKPINMFTQENSRVERLAFLNNYDTIAIASKTSYLGKKLIKLYNIKTKQVIHQYKVHSDKITALKTHPNKDYLMTASKDKEICLWDVNQPDRNAAARLNLEEATHPSIAFDPKGVCFAIGATVRHKTFIQLFDMRKIGDGCFDKFEIDADGNLRGWHNIQFSPNGKQMLLTPHRVIKNGVPNMHVPHYLIDSFTGKLLISFSDHCKEPDEKKKEMQKRDGINVQAMKGYEGPMYASFSPDSKFIVSGDRSCDLRVWSTDGKSNDPYACIGTWNSNNSWHNRAPIGPVLWNPFYDSVACGSLKLSLWQKYG